MQNIRNFCIIAHIDHGKSTLADRFLELTGTVEKRKMQEQYLDQMELERERGITIKLQPVRMHYTLNANRYTLNLIDTPGHVDFSYEVSRSLAAVEGAILLVDAAKGVQAQTIANLNLARKQGLVIIPVINKIDAPNARVAEAEEEIRHLFSDSDMEILRISAKTSENVERVLEAVVEKVPFPTTNHPLRQSFSEASKLPASPKLQRGEQTTNLFRALIFDSAFDVYKGVIAYVRVCGSIKVGDKIAICIKGQL